MQGLDCKEPDELIATACRTGAKSRDFGRADCRMAAGWTPTFGVLPSSTGFARINGMSNETIPSPTSETSAPAIFPDTNFASALVYIVDDDVSVRRLVA